MHLQPSTRWLHIGIGRATATALSKVGWDIVITARRPDQLEETKAQCEASSRALVLAGDISDERFVLELFKQIVSTFGEAVSCKTVFVLNVMDRRTIGSVIQRAGISKPIAVCAPPDTVLIERRDELSPHADRRPHD